MDCMQVNTMSKTMAIEAIIAGAGFRGCTEARRLAVAGARCWRSGFSQIGL